MQKKHSMTDSQKTKLLKWFAGQTEDTITSILHRTARIERSRNKNRKELPEEENIKYTSFLSSIKAEQQLIADVRTADIDRAVIAQYQNKGRKTKASPKKNAVEKHEKLIVRAVELGLTVNQIQTMLKTEYRIIVERSYLSRLIKEFQKNESRDTTEL